MELLNAPFAQLASQTGKRTGGSDDTEHIKQAHKHYLRVMKVLHIIQKSQRHVLKVFYKIRTLISNFCQSI